MSINLKTKLIEYTNKNDKIKFGAVNSSEILINRMLDILPKELYYNPLLKWLDPCTGYGNFAIILFKRLFLSLSEIIKDEGERKIHILTNMIFLVEINEEYFEYLKVLFGPTNLFIMDYLSWNNDILFDIIIGNPPFNSLNLKKVPTNKISSKKNDGITLWPYFIKKSIEILKNDAFFLFITPVIWMKPDKAGIYDILTKLSIIKLHSLTNTQTNKLFNGEAETPTCYFLIQNTISLNKIINVYDSLTNKYVEFKLRENCCIPLNNISIINKLLPYVDLYGSIDIKKIMTVSKKCKLSDTYSEDTPYKNIKTCILVNNQPKLVFEYSNIKLKYSGLPKLIFAHKMYGFPYYDKNGDYGISRRDAYVIINYTHSEFINLQYFFSTVFCLYLFEATRYRMKYLEKYIFNLIPDITKIDSFPNFSTNTNINKFFNLSQEEIDYINNLSIANYEFIFLEN